MFGTRNYPYLLHRRYLEGSGGRGGLFKPKKSSMRAGTDILIGTAKNCGIPLRAKHTIFTYL